MNFNRSQCLWTLNIIICQKFQIICKSGFYLVYTIYTFISRISYCYMNAYLYQNPIQSHCFGNVLQPEIIRNHSTLRRQYRWCGQVYHCQCKPFTINFSFFGALSPIQIDKVNCRLQCPQSLTVAMSRDQITDHFSRSIPPQTEVNVIENRKENDGTSSKIQWN